MRFIILFICMSFAAAASGQEERDTILRRCPLFITDTVSSNNFFIEGLPATLKVFRVKGDLTIVIQQKDQFFTLFFGDRKLKTGIYKIKVNAKDRDVSAKYSFRSGNQVSYVDVANGTVDCSFDEGKNMWRLKVKGMIANLVERSITYYKVRADFFVK